MRQVLTALLLVVFGISSPFGADSFRFCLLENKVLNSLDECITANKCCNECEADETGHDSAACCLEVKSIADSNLPVGPERIPAYYAVEIPQDILLAGVPTMEIKEGFLEQPVELLSLPPPSSRRAILGVWTI